MNRFLVKALSLRIRIVLHSNMRSLLRLVCYQPLRDDSALRALSSLRGLRGVPEVPPLCRETSVSRTANVGTVGMNGINILHYHSVLDETARERCACHQTLFFQK